MNKTKITPHGWLRNFLKTQMEGLTGHIEVAGYPYNSQFWGAQELPNITSWAFWWPFEQTGYHIDGYVRTAILLGNGAQIAKAKRMIYSVIDHPDTDGYLGPKQFKTVTDGFTRWSHAVFFRACLAMYAYNHDPKIITALTNHFLGCPVDHSGERNVINVEIMLAAYGVNGNKALLDMAVEAYEKARIDAYLKVDGDPMEPVRIHGVTYNELAKLGAILYRYTGNETYLQCSVRAYEKVKALYLLPGGCMSSSEFTVTNRYDEAYETCDIADMAWSLGYLAQCADDPAYCDMLEKNVLNAGIGSVTEDFKALQYFSCANQLITNKNSSHATLEKGNGAMRYAPKPFTECCTGNVNRIMPNYVLDMWSSRENTVTAWLYGPNSYSGTLSGKKFSIVEETNYPFDLSVKLQIQTAAPFTLRLRIPGWCTGYQISGAEYYKENGFAVIAVTGDTQLTVSFDAQILRHTNDSGVYFSRGPLVYSLGMKGERVKEGNPKFPKYSISPDRAWNYAIAGDGAPEYIPGGAVTWDLDGKLPIIRVDARKVESWKLVVLDKIISYNSVYKPVEKEGQFPITPLLPDMSEAVVADTTQRITLYPYGACKVRMTVLPQV